MDGPLLPEHPARRLQAPLRRTGDVPGGRVQRRMSHVLLHDVERHPCGHRMGDMSMTQPVRAAGGQPLGTARIDRRNHVRTPPKKRLELPVHDGVADAVLARDAGLRAMPVCATADQAGGSAALPIKCAPRLAVDSGSASRPRATR